MNNICLTGNNVKDIELKALNNGKFVATGTIAVRRDFKNNSGEYESDFINFVVYGPAAEVMSKYINKGDKFGIVGRLQIRKSEHNGQTRYFTEVVVSGFDFPPKGSGSNSDTNTPSRRNEAPRQQNKPDNDPFAHGGQTIDISDDDLPF